MDLLTNIGKTIATIFTKEEIGERFIMGFEYRCYLDQDDKLIDIMKHVYVVSMVKIDSTERNIAAIITDLFNTRSIIRMNMKTELNVSFTKEMVVRTWLDNINYFYNILCYLYRENPSDFVTCDVSIDEIVNNPLDNWRKEASYKHGIDISKTHFIHKNKELTASEVAYLGTLYTPNFDIIRSQREDISLFQFDFDYK